MLLILYWCYIINNTNHGVIGRSRANHVYVFDISSVLLSILLRNSEYCAFHIERLGRSSNWYEIGKCYHPDPFLREQGLLFLLKKGSL